MKFEDYYYFSRGTVFVESDTDGTVVMLSANGNSYLGTIVDGVFKFTVPGRERYDVSIVVDDVPTVVTAVNVGFGETKTVKI